MLSRVPAGISPARSEAAVPVDWIFTAELGAPNEVLVLPLEAVADEVLEAAVDDALEPVADDALEVAGDDALELELAEEPVTDFTAAASCELTRLSACW